MYVLLQIPSDPKNAWLLGISMVRWTSLLATLTGIIFLFFFLGKSWKKPKWFLIIISQITNKFNQKNRWLVVSLVLFTGFTLIYISALLLPMIMPGYRPLMIRLSPLIGWGLLLILQSICAVIYLYFKAHPENIWPRRENLSLPRMAVRLFIISLIIRSLLAAAVISSNVQPEFDETGYYGLALGIESVLDDLLSGSVPTTEHLDSAYGDGRWPLLHPFVLAIGLLLFGSQVASARIMMVIVSAMTTPLVFMITKRVSNDKTASFASLVHIFYPSFLAYSHYLWSETTFIFLLLLSLYATILIVEAKKSAQIMLLAIACGLFLGLGGLTRSAMMPYFVAIPVLLLFTIKDKILRISAPLLVLSTIIITILPWVYSLSVREGQLTLLGTNGGYTLFLSNNSWLPEKGYGSSLEFRKTTQRVQASIEYFKKSYNVRDGIAANALAKYEITQHPGDFLLRSLERVRYFFFADSFVVRHIVHAVYPPVSNIIVVAIWVISLSGFILFLSITSFGLFNKSKPIAHRSLIILLALSGMALPAITIANSRYYLPVLVILLPFSGAGIAKILHYRPQKHLIKFILTTSLLSVVVISTLPNYIQNNLRPSIYYAEIIRRIDKFIGGKPEFSDRFDFRSTNGQPDTITITITSEGYLFRWRESRTLEWEISEASRNIRFDIYSLDPTAQLEVIVTSKNSRESVQFSLLNKEDWNNWTEIGLEDIEYYWRGGGY